MPKLVKGWHIIPQSMKIAAKIISLLIILSTPALKGCIEIELFPEETVRVTGRIVEAYDTNRPIDSVLVRGCTSSFSLIFPTHPSCIEEVYSDHDGFFDLQFTVKNLDPRFIEYFKPGYINLDSCITLQDGNQECYMQPLPTEIRLGAATKRGAPILYDSATVKLINDNRDTTFNFIVHSSIASNKDSVYRWVLSEDPSLRLYRNARMPVQDDSEVKVIARYFRNDSLRLIDSKTIFCKKAAGCHYRILNE